MAGEAGPCPDSFSHGEHRGDARKGGDTPRTWMEHTQIHTHVRLCKINTSKNTGFKVTVILEAGGSDC